MYSHHHFRDEKRKEFGHRAKKEQSQDPVAEQVWPRSRLLWKVS